MSHAMDIGDTLAQVNVVRQAFGMPLMHELPNANIGDPAACLFYRALSDCGAKHVAGDSVRFQSERQARLVADLWGVRASGDTVKAPSQMRRTINAFDAANFPAYGMPGERFEPTYEEEENEDEYYDEDEDE